MTLDHATTRSMLFSLHLGRLPHGQRRQLQRALLLISEQARHTLHEAHAIRVEPFPREAEAAAVEELRRALVLITPGRNSSTRIAA